MSGVPFAPEELALASAYLVRAAGLVFDESRRVPLARALRARLQATSTPDVAAYLRVVASDDRERDALLDAVTIRATHFLRNGPQMQALRDRILPDLLAEARRRGRPATVWSAGCASGEEPYSIAMLALLAAGPAADAGQAPPLRVLGTDVSAEALRTAQQGRYGAGSLGLVPHDLRRRFFDEQDGAWVVREEVRHLVDFRQHNLVAQAPPYGADEVDLVLCRNVAIYFSRETTRALMLRFWSSLREGGWLLLGHAESLWQVLDAFALERVGDAYAYRRPARQRPVHREEASSPAASPPAPASAPTVEAPPRASRRAGPLAEAEALAGAGRYDAALALLRRCVTTGPGAALDPRVHVLHGRLLMLHGRDQEAVEPLRRATYLDPGTGSGHFLLGLALARSGDAAASGSFRAAAETLPRTPPEDLADLLDGRPVADLVQLCFRLAEPRAQPASRAVGEVDPQT